MSIAINITGKYYFILCSILNIKFKFIYLFFISCVLTGCISQKKTSLKPLTLEILPKELSFAEEVITLPKGVSQHFNTPPFGPASVVAGDFYLSGLGQECRSARAVQSGQSRAFAVCREENGVWRVIPTVFASMVP